MRPLEKAQWRGRYGVLGGGGGKWLLGRRRGLCPQPALSMSETFWVLDSESLTRAGAGGGPALWDLDLQPQFVLV